MCLIPSQWCWSSGLVGLFVCLQDQSAPSSLTFYCPSPKPASLQINTSLNSELITPLLLLMVLPHRYSQYIAICCPVVSLI